MKFLVVLAAGLLICQAATVPQDVNSSSTAVPVPHNDLLPPPVSSETEKPHPEVEIPAVIVEVTKDHTPQVDIPIVVQPQEVEYTTIQPKIEIKTSTPVITIEEKTTAREMRSLAVVATTEGPTTILKAVTEELTKSEDNHSTTSTHSPCDVLCTKFEFEPICATNGLCLHEFPNQCILETFNCKHPTKKFSATKDDRCQMHWLTKCEEGDLV